ncbi:response regulator receiver protein [Pseudodesulfovibrio mercurii]|uniref:Response regulator receiver protein n=1 Tax=Pseudodesulfovibrio mercurii TaxID=641491 RepID=F0JDL1_9BACT|nr:response regulator [Pseudodesulfovibrio mercurii]EGB13380.1 response regulator receiver protein [Pseudodesulfovibrio mercurii]
MTDPVRILLVDDEAAFVAALSRRLGHLGASVRTAEGGVDAWAVLESGPVDVVLLDMNMPDLNGIETLKIIRKNFPETEVIVLTGEGDMTRHMQSLDAGAFDYLLKPVPLERLWKRILDAAGR